MMKIFFTSILLMIVILSQSQDIYYLTFANSNIVFHEDLRKGNTKTILEMKEASLAINFHPNGRLYSLSYNSVTEYDLRTGDRKSTRLNSSHVATSYAVFCLKKKTCADEWTTHVGRALQSA